MIRFGFSHGTWTGLAIVAILGGAIAAVAPLDVAFSAATGGSALLRVGLLWLLAYAGAFAGSRVGLRLQPHGSKHPAVVGVTAAIIVAAAIAVIDGVLFRSVLPSYYVSFITSLGLSERYAYFMLRAFNENVFYRLFLFSGIVFVLGKVWNDGYGRPTRWVFWVAMIAAQVINITLNVGIAAPPDGVAMVIYDGVRYIAPGMCWAWIYWRYGFATAEIASVGCHVFLQPALGYFLS